MAPTAPHVSQETSSLSSWECEDTGNKLTSQLLGTPVLVQILVLMIKLKSGRKLLKMCNFKQQVLVSVGEKTLPYMEYLGSAAGRSLN